MKLIDSQNFDIAPTSIDTTGEFGDEFGTGAGPVAREIVRFCQERGTGWVPLVTIDFVNFCSFGLVPLGDLVRWDQAARTIQVSERFVQLAYRHYPARS